MKSLKYLLSGAAALLLAASCAIVGEDTFDRSPAAAVLESHNDILVTTSEGVMAESVTFAWQPARFVNAPEYLYDLYMVHGEKELKLASGVADNYFTIAKTELRTKMLASLDLEQNSTSEVTMYVVITDADGKALKSNEISLKVYLYDDAVPSVLSAAEDAIVLDKDTPAELLKVLSWTPARLVYGEDVTYNVAYSVGGGEEKVYATGLYDCGWEVSVDALNEAVVAAGGVEDALNKVAFKVYAVCESIPDGIASNSVSVDVTTYVATFAETIWIPGNHQNWDPATAPTLNVSKNTKGLYQGFVDLTTETGVDAEFKFSEAPAWADVDYGFEDVTVETKGEGALAFAYATSTKVGKSNVKVPSGFYYILLDKKFGKLTLIQVHNLEMMGSFNGWSEGMAMNWNAAAQIWTAAENVTVEADTPLEFKFRFNSNWDYSIGVDELTGNVKYGAGNAKIEKASEYRISLDASSSDFAINALDLNMPDYLTMPGDYSGHSWNIDDDFRLYLKDADKGIYMGAVAMYGTTHGFKFGKAGEWLGMSGSVAGGFKIEGDANGMVEDGAYAWTVDLSTNTATAVPVTRVGVIGSFAASGWGSDIEMTFDSASLTYSAEVTFAAGDEWKFRFNNGWDFNYGLAGGVLRQDGGNIVADAAGTYVITLDMAHGSNATYTLTAK